MGRPKVATPVAPRLARLKTAISLAKLVARCGGAKRGMRFGPLLFGAGPRLDRAGPESRIANSSATMFACVPTEPRELTPITLQRRCANLIARYKPSVFVERQIAWPAKSDGACTIRRLLRSRARRAVVPSTIAWFARRRVLHSSAPIPPAARKSFNEIDEGAPSRRRTGPPR